MSSASAKRPAATVADLLALPESERFHEILDGDLVRKATPTFEHGDAQSAIVAGLKGPFQRRSGGGQPGGWWIGTEVEVELSPRHVYRPDVVGWRRERVPERPQGTPVRIRPDWICEVLSPTNQRTDRVTKLNQYHQFGVPHYWLADPTERTLSVLRWTSEGYLLALAAGGDARVRAEPFDAVELSVGALFGDEDG